MLEDLPDGVEVTFVTRATTPEDIVHREEVAGLVQERGGRLYELVGSRQKVRLDARTLTRSFRTSPIVTFTSVDPPSLIETW